MKNSSRNRTLKESQSDISKHIRTFGTPPDFSIICKDTLFMAHSAVIVPASTYFLKLFMATPSASFNILMAPEIVPVDVEHVLTYIYRAAVKVTPEFKHGFFRAAKQLHINSILEMTNDKTTSDVISHENLSHNDGNSKNTATNLEDSIPSAPPELLPANPEVKSKLPVVVQRKPRKLTPFKHVEASVDSPPANSTVIRALKNLSLSQTCDESIKVMDQHVVDATYPQDAPPQENRAHCSTSIPASSASWSLSSNPFQRKVQEPAISGGDDSSTIWHGRPLLLSLTKGPDDLWVADQAYINRFNPTLRENEALIESGIDTKTYHIGSESTGSYGASLKMKALGHQRQPLTAVNKAKDESAGKRDAHPSTHFSIADLVNQKKQSQEEMKEQTDRPKTNYESSSSSSSSGQVSSKSKTSGYVGGEEGKGTGMEIYGEHGANNGNAKQPPMPRRMSVKARFRNWRLGGQVTRVSGSSTTCQTASRVVRRYARPLVRPTDESSDALEFDNKFKRKLPLGKRRRKVAANRPDLLNTSLNTSAFPSPPKRPKFKKRLIKDYDS